MKNARETALLVLYDIDEKKAYSNIALKNRLGASGLGGTEKAFVSNMVYGTISRRITLDYIIQSYSRIKLKKISPFILNILRLGIYQIYFMRTPDSAAVNESVKLAKRYGHKASSGFVNGVLRSVIKGRDSLEYPSGEVQNLSVKYSFPEWMCEKFIAEFSRERAESIMEALNSAPEMIVRVNTLKITREELIAAFAEKGISASPDKTAPDAVRLSGTDVANDSFYKDGLYTVQDTAAQLAVLALNPKPGDNVIDMCAAPGGKSTYAAQLMKNQGRITAFDIYPHRTELIQKNAERLGIDIIDAQVRDAAEYCAELAETADRIIVDVPCSGLGVIRRKPDIKYTAEDDSAICDVQYAILENAAKYLKRGGELVYSTCTILPDENERITDKFLNEHRDFRLAPVYAAGGVNGGCVTLYPDTDGTDGFFICKLKKNGESVK